MSGPSIRVARDFYAIRVWINDLLHVHIPTDHYRGLQSWLKPKPSIEITLDQGAITLEYDAREKWELVLSGLEGVL